jgi:hypothetical protein
MNFFQATNSRISQAERELQPLLVDDDIQVLSSFEMNKVASLTYGELVCDDIFELIEKIISHPLDFSPLTIQKTLVVTRHIMIYGSEKCVNSGYSIGRFVENLTTFNSVLAAQQQQGVHAFFQRIQVVGSTEVGLFEKRHKKFTSCSPISMNYNEYGMKARVKIPWFPSAMTKLLSLRMKFVTTF